ncbi:MAG: DUF790 family protein, partial [Polyangiaceae bacterium]|nr:DUF790 family protein [Polyangiaceae bacterium]
MIGPDLVRARRRGDELFLSKFKSTDREQALAFSEEILQALREGVGQSQEEIALTLKALERPAKYEKLYLSLRKLADDLCVYESAAQGDPVELRLALFERAALSRSALGEDQSFDRDEVLEAEAKAREQPAESLEARLFS